jgi:hypothetical protein
MRYSKRYSVDGIIKRLQQSGKVFVSKEELTCIANESVLPGINSIDDIIDIINGVLTTVEAARNGNATARSTTEGYNCDYDYFTFSKARELINVSRPTLYTWKEYGIITTHQKGASEVFSLKELYQTLVDIKNNKRKDP